MIFMSDSKLSTSAISYYQVQQRINDHAISFAVKLALGYHPSNFESGQNITFQLINSADLEDYETFNGKIEIVDKNQVIANQLFDITGYNKGLLLSKQNFSWNCTLTNPTSTDPMTILDQILENTDITIGRGQSFQSGVVLSNSPNDSNFFGGVFNPKYNAVIALFEAYTKAAGLSSCQWYVDGSNQLWWFEVASSRTTPTLILQGDGQSKYEISETAENIANYYEGFAGENSSIHMVLKDDASIAKYDLRVGDSVQDTDIKTQDALQAELQTKLNQTAWPVYTAKVTQVGIHPHYCGELVMFPDDQKYYDVTFTISSVTYEGNPANPVTNLELTTDPSTTNPTNLAEDIQSMIDNSTKTSVVATVVDIDSDTGQVLMHPLNSTVNVPGGYV